MTLAFNILVPYGKYWRWLLVIGNLSLIASPDFLKPPTPLAYEVIGARNLRIIPDTGAVVEVLFTAEDRTAEEATPWHQTEFSFLERFRWSDGNSALAIINPHPFGLVADIEFGLRSKLPVNNIRPWRFA